jgi:alkaline phosphatase
MMYTARKIATIAVIVLAGMLLVAHSALADSGRGEIMRERLRQQGIKNVIVMIPDGCDETVQTAARSYKGEDLQVDKMVGGAVKTHMANSIITGSAAAATAFATGHKTTVKFLGVGPRVDDLLTGFLPTAAPYAPVASVLEAAKLAGKATGIVATSRVTHATPAAFACHIPDRNLDNEIMEHMVYNNVDVVFGGGARHLIPEGASYTTSFNDTWGGKRTDGEDLLKVLKKRGYTFVDNKDDMLALVEGPVWGMFDDSHMQPDIDRQYFAEHEPSLAEMTQKAIELLSQDEDGFFLMVEGSQVDWAGHNNDPIYMVTDFIAFDDAVKVACDFAEADGRTLVLAYPDHNTGGMKIGHYTTAVGYTETRIEDLVDPLKGMTITSPGLVAMLVDDSDGELAAKTEKYWNVVLSSEDIAEIRALEPSVGLAYALARVVSKNYTVIGWTTHGHTGETVPVWLHGADAPVGTIDNTELALMAAGAMNVDLEKISDFLYVDLEEAGVDFSIDATTDPANPVVIAGGATLPVSKDYMIVKKRWRTIAYKLPGLTVHAPETGKVYVSQRALRILKRI